MPGGVAGFAASAPGEDAASLLLSVASGPFGEPDRWLYTERFTETSEPWRAVGVVGGRYLVRLFGHADFLLDRGARSACVHVAPGAAIEAVEPLFLEQVLPLLWSLVGTPCLHASAVAWGDGADACAIAFAGRSRSGKSTLAGSLAGTDAGAREGDAADAGAADESGAVGAAGTSESGAGVTGVGAPVELLSDDCTVVEVAGDRVLAHPGHRSVRLLADSAEALFASAVAGERALDGEKRRVALRGGSRAVPLVRIYLLEAAAPSSGAPIVTPVRARDAVALLAGCLFRIDPEERSRLADELALLERIAARTVVARLSVPRRFEALAQVRAVIAADLGRRR